MWLWNYAKSNQIKSPKDWSLDHVSPPSSILRNSLQLYLCMYPNIFACLCDETASWSHSVSLFLDFAFTYFLLLGHTVFCFPWTLPSCIFCFLVTRCFAFPGLCLDVFFIVGSQISFVYSLLFCKLFKSCLFWPQNLKNVFIWSPFFQLALCILW